MQLQETDVKAPYRSNGLNGSNGHHSINGKSLVHLPKEDILGYDISAAGQEQCIDYIIQTLSIGTESRYFVCANPHSLEIARHDEEFEEAIVNADFVIPDGIGVVLASRVLGGEIRERVTGSDIFLGVSEALNRKGGFRYFFLGSSESNLNKVVERMRTDFPDIVVAGSYAPPFSEDFTAEENLRMVEMINGAKPDIVWVGMTAPKQEKWIFAHQKALSVKLIGPIGAAFDFYSGSVRRPGIMVQRMGLEWLARFVREPLRLWKRNLISSPSFMARVITHQLRGKGSSTS